MCVFSSPRFGQVSANRSLCFLSLDFATFREAPQQPLPQRHSAPRRAQQQPDAAGESVWLAALITAISNNGIPNQLISTAARVANTTAQRQHRKRNVRKPRRWLLQNGHMVEPGV